MRLAVLADIHGNRLALDAVLADLDRRGGADRVIDLGDCASGPLWPRETMERLHDLGALTVRGNHDRQMATFAPADMVHSDRFAHDELTFEQRAWLGMLPAELMVAPGVLAFHGCPDRDDAYLLDDIQGGRLVRGCPQSVERRLGEIGPTKIVLCGHSHRPDLMLLPRGVLAVNPGSVGCPAYDSTLPASHLSESGTPHARYAILDLGTGAQPTVNETCVSFVAVSYDQERAALRAQAKGRLDWMIALRTGRVSAP